MSAERQVSVEKLVTKLRTRNEELSYQNAMLETVLDDLEAENTQLKAKIDELAPTEEIEDASDEEG